MNSKENILSIYPNLGYWMMLFILAAFGGFYHSYFSNLVLVFLLVQDIRKNRNPEPFSIALGLYVLVQLFYATLTKTPAWEKLISIFLS